MNRMLPLILVSLMSFAGLAQAQDVTAEIGEDNLFTIKGTADLLGLDFESPSGNLIPVPGDVASPFSFLLQNTDMQVTFGNVTEAFELDGEVKLAVGYKPGADLDDLTLNWGSTVPGSSPISVPVTRAKIVPEPSSCLLLISSLLGLGVLRKRR